VSKKGTRGRQKESGKGEGGKAVLARKGGAFCGEGQTDWLVFSEGRLDFLGVVVFRGRGGGGVGGLGGWFRGREALHGGWLFLEDLGGYDDKMFFTKRERGRKRKRDSKKEKGREGVTQEKKEQRANGQEKS